MEQVTEKLQYISVEDIRKKPELITQLLLKDKDVSIILEKRGNKIRYAYLKTYDKEVIRILEEAKNEHKKIKEKGYTREQAFIDFNEARKQMNKYL